MIVHFEEARRIRTLSALSDEELKGLLELGVQTPFEKDQTLFAQGAPTREAILVLRGRVSVTVTAGGETQRVGELWPGEIAGEAAFFQADALHEARLAGEGDGVVLHLDAERLEAAQSTRAVAALQAHLVQTLARQIKTNDLGIRKAWQEIRAAQAALSAREQAQEQAQEQARQLAQARPERPRRPRPAPTPEPSLVDRVSSFFFGRTA